MNLLPSQSRLKELLHYDPETGIFMWSKRRLGIKINTPLGCDNGNGYLRITVDGISRYAHRLAWIYVHGSQLDVEIDHINGNRSDNRIVNLRAASPCENSQNKRGPQSNSKSGLLGVSWYKNSNKWQAHIAVSKKRIYLGLYADKEMAYQAYLKAKAELHPFSTIGNEK